MSFSERVGAIAQAIARHIALPEVIGEAVAAARELCHAEGASLLLHEPATGSLTFDQVDGGAATTLKTVRLPPGEGIVGRVAQTRRPALVTDVRADPSFSGGVDAATGFQTRSVVAVPLVMGDELLGVLEAVRSEAREPFAAEHLELLEQLAPHVAIAVHNAQLMLAMKRNNLELEERVKERTSMISRGKREWELTFDAISEPIALVDQFTVQRANRAWAEEGMISVTQAPGARCYLTIAGRASPCPGCPLLQPFENSAVTEVAFPNDRLMRVSAWRMVSERGPVSVVQYHELTENRRLEARVQEAERMAAVGQLAAGAAHEINNPLAAITANLSLFASGGDQNLDATDRAEMIEESLHAARRVRDIVAALRDFARVEKPGKAGSKTLINESVERVAAIELSTQHPLLVKLQLLATHPVLVSSQELELAVTHLLRNARQAIKTGQHIKVHTYNDSGQVVLEVTDEGAGIAPEHLPRIFEPFFSTRGVGKGMGLGLTTVFAIVRRAGGSIHVKSEKGSGSTFIVRLPSAIGHGASSHSEAA